MYLPLTCVMFLRAHAHGKFKIEKILKYIIMYSYVFLFIIMYSYILLFIIISISMISSISIIIIIISIIISNSCYS